MASRPIHDAAYARLSTYGLERVLDRVIDGHTLNVIAADPAINCSRPVLSSWLLGRFTGAMDAAGKAAAAERRQLYETARRFSAMSHAEDGLELLDAENDPKAAALAAARANFRLRLAEVFDRERFGAPKANAVVVQIGVQHLDALRKRTIVAVAGVDAPAAVESGEPDYAIETDETQLAQLIGDGV